MADGTDFNAVLYEKLYSKLAVALGVGSREGAYTIGESLLSIYNPGQYIPAGLDPIQNPEDDEEVSQIFDTAPMFDFTYVPVNLRVSQAYKNILDYKVYPIADLSASERKKLDDARTDYLAREQACNDAMYAFFEAADAYDEAEANYKNQTGPAPSRTLKGKMDSAHNKWTAAGRVQQETNLSVIAQLEGRDGSAFWNRLETNYAANQSKLKTGMDYPSVSLSPKYSSWFGNAGWTKFKFDQTDMDNQSNSTALGVAGNLDASFGIVKISGAADFTKDSKYVKVDQTSLSFECELMRVSVSRRWMNPLLFSSRAWKWDQAAPGGGVEYSTGGSLKNFIKPTGPFVAIPTTAILARNVKIVGQFQNTVENDMKMAIQGNASLGIGPFSISGRVDYRDESHSIKGSIAGNTIECKDTQIIAAISQVLPQLPDPDNNLPWPK